MKRTWLLSDIIILKRRRAMAKRVILEAKSSSWRQFCTSLTCNTDLKVWKVIKSFSGHRSSYFIPTLHAQGISVKNKQHKSNKLANQFALSSSCLNYPPRFVNVTLTIQTRLLRNPMSHTTPIDPALNQDFSINELLSTISDTKNTTPGPDNICCEMFKHMSIKSLEVMLQLFNKIWFTGKIPPSWLHSIVAPIPKPNKPAHLLSSYGPISLTSNVCKLFEKMIVRRLNWFLEYHNVLHISQSGFRQRCRTTDHLLRLHDAIHKSMANKINVLSVFIDIEKAYGMVNKEVLLPKLLSYGISGRMFHFIRSFLSNRTFQFRIGSTLSMTNA